jgi:predicted exporter
VAAAAGAEDDPVLTLAEATQATAPLSFLSMFRLETRPGETTHVIPLDGVVDSAAVAAAAAGLPGVRLVDPAAEFSALLGKYRTRAAVLLGASLLLMAPLLLWRYGPRGGIRVLLPPLLAVVLTPALRALGGAGFTFFDAMALVLVLSVGVDYAVFVAETTRERRNVTLLAVALAALTTLMSFGMLAWSEARAVHAFGATMLVGVTLVFLLVPLAAAANRSR